MARMQCLIERLRKFNEERDWEKFHTQKNLATSISIEANELLRLYQWTDRPDKDPAPEMADILIYMLIMADNMDIDLIKEANYKVTANAIKYPVEKARGNCKKAEEL
jgi:NTP pyrophosphatase (non-canonical NTP hydrolase)